MCIKICSTGYFGWLTAGKLENPCDLRKSRVVESELASTITHVETMKAMDAYRSVALKPADIARAVRHIIESPESVDTTEITIRPTASAN